MSCFEITEIRNSEHESAAASAGLAALEKLDIIPVLGSVRLDADCWRSTRGRTQGNSEV
jgi:hypothetical protein